MFISTRANTARAALLLGAGLSFASPIWAQNAAFGAAADNAATAPLQAALADGGVPLSLLAGALDKSWRRFRPGATTPLANEQLFTRGKTVTVGSETFLLVYRGQLDGTNLDEKSMFALQNSGEKGVTADGYGKLLSSSILRLSLLNVRTLGDMNDVRAFDAATDILVVPDVSDAQIQHIKEKSANEQSASHLKQIGLALLQYTQDYDEKLPPMRSSQSMADIKKYDVHGMKSGTVQQILAPYTNAPEIFAHPTTHEIYRPNLNVSGRSLASLSVSPEQVITFYEASPAPDGTRAVLYLDGHVRRELETAWANIQDVSNRFAPPFDARKRIATTNSTNATVTLTGAAAMAYMLRRQRDNKGRPQEVYLSESTNRVYYRDAQTKRAIWLSSPTGTIAPGGITIPYEQAQEFREFQGYNGQPFGRTFGDIGVNVATITPKVKTALGAEANLRGSQINVDTTSDNKTVVLRGTTTTGAQKDLAESIARKNAPEFRIVNQLIVQAR